MPQQAPTFESIAAAARVSKATVSLALRESPKVREETRLRIQKVATELGYRPNPLVSAQMSHIRSRKKRKTITTIGFLNSWYDDSSGKRVKWHIIGRFAQGARDRAESLGYNFQVLDFDRKRYSDARIEQILFSRQIDGLVLAPLEFSDSTFEIDWSRFALSAIGYFEAFGNIHRVYYDNFKGMQNLMTELIAREYRRIGFITDLEDESRGGHFWIGSYLDYQFRKIPEKDRIPILNFPVREKEMTPDDYRKTITWLETNQPDVVLSFRDGFLKFFQQEGYRVPKDFGYAALTLSPDMKDCGGFIQNLEDIGATAVDIIVERLYCNERGALPDPKITLLGGKFREGTTLRKRPENRELVGTSLAAIADTE